MVPGGVGIALGPPGARGLKRGGDSEGLCPAPHTVPPSAGSKSTGNMKMSMVNTPLAMRVLPLAPSLDDTVSHAAATCPKLCGAQSPPRCSPPPLLPFPSP